SAQPSAENQRRKPLSDNDLKSQFADDASVFVRGSIPARTPARPECLKIIHGKPRAQPPRLRDKSRLDARMLQRRYSLHPPGAVSAPFPARYDIQVTRYSLW